MNVYRISLDIFDDSSMSGSHCHYVVAADLAAAAKSLTSIQPFGIDREAIIAAIAGGHDSSVPFNDDDCKCHSVKMKCDGKAVLVSGHCHEDFGSWVNQYELLIVLIHEDGPELMAHVLGQIRSAIESRLAGVASTVEALEFLATLDRQKYEEFITPCT